MNKRQSKQKIIIKKDIVQLLIAMQGQHAESSSPSDKTKQEKLQMIDTMKAPIVQIGKTSGYEVIENYDLGAGPIHVTWVFKPAYSESLPDMRIGFICITEFSQFSINESIARSMINIIDK